MDEQKIKDTLCRLNRYREDGIKIPLTATICPADIEWLMDELERQLKLNTQAPAMRVLLGRWVEYMRIEDIKVAAKLLDDTNALLEKAKDADADKN